MVRRWRGSQQRARALYPSTSLPLYFTPAPLHFTSTCPLLLPLLRLYFATASPLDSAPPSTCHRHPSVCSAGARRSIGPLPRGQEAWPRLLSPLLPLLPELSLYVSRAHRVSSTFASTFHSVPPSTCPLLDSAPSTCPLLFAPCPLYFPSTSPLLSPWPPLYSPSTSPLLLLCFPCFPSTSPLPPTSTSPLRPPLLPPLLPLYFPPLPLRSPFYLPPLRSPSTSPLLPLVLDSTSPLRPLYFPCRAAVRPEVALRGFREHPPKRHAELIRSAISGGLERFLGAGTFPQSSTNRRGR